MANQTTLSASDNLYCVVFFNNDDEAVAILRNLEYEEAAYRRYSELDRLGGLRTGRLFEEGSVEQFYYSENRGLPEMEIRPLYIDTLLARV